MGSQPSQPKPTKRPGLVAARVAAGLTQEDVAAKLGVERTTVYRWESGESIPRPWTRPALAKLLSLDNHQLAALLDGASYEAIPASPSFQPLSPDQSRTKTDRKTFLITTALGAGAGAVVARHRPAGGDHGELAAAVSDPTAHYRRMEQAVSSEELAPAVEAHLALAAWIVRTHLSNPAGYGALSEIAGLAAWLAADRGDNSTARRRYSEAVAHTGRAHHPLLTSYMTASLGFFAIESGHARQGVVLLDRAAVQVDTSAPDTARAWLFSLQAIGHATIGDTAATLAALRTAERLTSRSHGEPHWPWVFVFDRAKAARYQAAALARLGDVRAATAAFDAAYPSITGAKPRAMAQLDHARVLAGTGRYGEGCQLAVEALRVGRDYGSERIITRVRDLRAILPSRTDEARDLDDALAALYYAEAP